MIRTTIRTGDIGVEPAPNRRPLNQEQMEELPSLNLYRENSVAFFALVRQWTQLINGADESVSEGLSFWCRDLPAVYQRLVWRETDVPKCEIMYASEGELEITVDRLAKAVRRRHDTAFFLMEDSYELAARYASLGCQPVRVNLGRRSFPSSRKSIYLRLFSLVNEAALASHGNWQRFRLIYEDIYERFTTSQELGRLAHKVVEATVDRHMHAIEDVISKAKPIIIVDSGMQGTFALPLMNSITARFGSKSVTADFFLLAAYPWLQQLYFSRFVTTQASLVARLEQDVEDRLLTARRRHANAA